MALEESLLGNSQFLGRDGFRWWIGQVAPREAQKDQIDEGKGWGSRYKVRIMGYHPFTDDLEDVDLPWAMCMLPTTSGSGAANYSKSTQLQQGDVVFGFFLDGDEGQVPCILGHFGQAGGVKNSGEFGGKFEPGTGFTGNIKINEKTEVEEETGKPNTTNEQNAKSNPTNSSGTKGQNVDQSGAGKKEIIADTCTPSAVSRMALQLETMAQRIEDLQMTGSKLEAEINAVADAIETQTNGFVGSMFQGMYEHLEPKLQKGLDDVYNKTFGEVFAQTGDSPQSYALAHAAGVASQTGEVVNIKNAENALACVANKIVEGLRGTVADMLKDLLASGLGIAGCVTANFVSKLMNNIINDVTSAMAGPLSALSNLLPGGFDVAEFLRSSAFLLEDFSGFLDCGQTNKDKCPPAKKYEVGGGIMEKGADPYNYVMSQMQKSAKPGGGIGGAVGGALGGLGGAIDSITGFEFGSLTPDFGNLIPKGVTDTLGAPGRVAGLIEDLSAGGSCVGGKKDCGDAKLQIFGGGGIGAIGNVVVGGIIENSGLGGIAEGVTRTASIIGVDMKIPGVGYKTPPAISFSDKCGVGFGAHGHAILDDNGGIAAIVMDSVGEGYPVVTDPPQNVGVTTVIIEKPGKGYTPGDQIDESVFIFQTGFAPAEEDAYENLTTEEIIQTPIFDVKIDPETGGVQSVEVLNILSYDVPPVIEMKSTTGVGAVLRPVFGTIPEAKPPTKLVKVIDCIGKI